MLWKKGPRHNGFVHVKTFVMCWLKVQKVNSFRVPKGGFLSFGFFAFELFQIRRYFFRFRGLGHLPMIHPSRSQLKHSRLLDDILRPNRVSNGGGVEVVESDQGLCLLASSCKKGFRLAADASFSVVPFFSLSLELFNFGD